MKLNPNKPLTERQINRIAKLIGVAIIIFAIIIAILFSSCSAAPELLKPTSYDHIVVWRTEDYVYFWDYNDHTKLDSLKNYNSEMWFVGDAMFCKFRTLGGLR